MRQCKHRGNPPDLAPLALAIIALAMAGCERSGQAPAESLPARAGAYDRASLEAIPTERAPETLRRLGVKRVQRAVYRGEAEIALTAYEMTSEAGAFEALQTWRPAGGALAFQAGRLFLVAESPHAGRERLQAFAEAIERR